MSRAQHLVGEVFGELVVERLAGIDGARGRLWECRCECGRLALRTTGALNATRRNNGSSCCEDCRRELWAGMVLDRAARRREAMVARCRALWSSERTLWSGWDTEHLMRSVAGALAEEFGVPRTPLEDQNFSVDATWLEDSTPATRRRARTRVTKAQRDVRRRKAFASVRRSLDRVGMPVPALAYCEHGNPTETCRQCKDERKSVKRILVNEALRRARWCRAEALRLEKENEALRAELEAS